MVLLGIAAVLLVPAAPRMLTRLRPAELWGGRVEAGAAGARAGGALTGGAQAAGGSGESALASLPPMRPTVHVLEQVSPIVGSGSTLVEALGIEMHGKFTTVLPKGTPAPVRRVVTFRTSGDDQKEIRLHVLRGLSEAAAEDHT